MDNKANFLSNKPSGLDLFDGQSQVKVAEAIKKHIEEVDGQPEPETEQERDKVLPRIIGIEGSWGSGKSNTLLQLDKKLGDNYYFFTYDAWGNQEDLQRRSLLQQLTMKLIDDKMLVGDTTINVVSSALDFTPKPISVSWKTRVETLISRKSATHNITIPTIYESTKYFALMIIVTGLLAPLLNAIKGSSMPCWYSIFAFIAALTPFAAFTLLMYNKQKEREETDDSQKKAELVGWSWKEMWQMYQTSGQTNTSTFTVSEMEPSVIEFREWMTDVSKALVPSKRLVVVFDNMDRLPKEKVRQLWSSIQTFFADKGYPKIWCVIPFDRVHLANAFSEAENGDKRTELTNYFIEKTFPVVYRIPDPIITDYKAVFEKLFAKAFDKREEQELINRCYRLKNTKPNIREIISFINKLVALTHEWGDSVRLQSMALFLLNRQEILGSNTETVIVNGSYLNGMEALFTRNEELDTEISALAYGVKKEDAAQLPMKNLINQALNLAGMVQFAEYAQRNGHFYVILKEVIDDMDATLLNNAINHVGTLSFDGLSAEDADNLHKVWNRLARLYLESKDKEIVFRKEVKTLMDNCVQVKTKLEINKHFLNSFTDKDNPHKGDEWYKVYRDLAIYSKEKGLKLELPEQTMENVDFVEYLKAAKEDYMNYPVKCSNQEMNQYCLGQITNNLDVMFILELLNGDKRYEFSGLLKSARELIENHHDVTSSNFEPVVKVLKYLSKDPLELQLDTNFLTLLKYEGDMIADYRVLMMLTGMEVAGLGDSEYEAMAQVVFKYESMETLWNKCQVTNTTAMVQMTKYLIEHDLHDSKPTETKNVITEMVTVAKKTKVAYQTVIKFLNEWGRKKLTTEEETMDLSTNLTEEGWIDALEADKNTFAKAVLSKYYRDCGTKDWNMFVNVQNTWQTANYWPKMLMRLVLDSDFWQTNPANMKLLTEHLITGICSESITSSSIDQTMLDKILENVKFSDVSSTVNEVLGKFSSTYHINEYKFMKLHHYFEKTINHEEIMLNKILRPIIGAASVQGVVLGNLYYYEPLLVKHLSQASDLKRELVKMNDTTKNNDMKALIGRLGIIEVREDEEGGKE